MSTDKRSDDQYPVLLIHKGKHGDRYILATNNEEEELAWLAMFTSLNVEDDVYSCSKLVGSQRAWFDKACEGDTDAARWLLINRSDYEYEEVFTECIDTPFSLLNKLMESLKDE